MKPKHVLMSLFLCWFITILSANPQTTEQTKNQTTGSQEFVEVVNVELTLRALKDGHTVSGLKQSDVTLYENGKPIPLTSFHEIRRRMGQHPVSDPQSTGGESKTTQLKPAKKRLFFLYFRVSEPDPRLQKVLGYFFKRVYRQGDYVLLMLGKKVYPITRRAKVAPTLSDFYNHLAKVTRETRFAKQRIANKVEELVRIFVNDFRLNEERTLPQETAIYRLISQYKASWENYKHESILLADKKLKAIAASLKNVEIEKWGLVFYQRDSFPVMNLESLYSLSEKSKQPLDRLKKEMAQLVRDMSKSDQSVQALKEIEHAFIEANATFHLLLSSPASQGKLESMYLRHSAIYTDWQRAFKGISTATGGSIIEDNKLQESLLQAVEWEDVYYRLTYAPASEGAEKRNIRIETNLKGVKLQYQRQLAINWEIPITIQLFSFNHPILEFSLTDYRQFFDGNHLFGDIDVKITSVDAKGKMITFNKIMEPDKEQLAVAMKLNFPTGGEYSLIIEALDRQTGQTAIYSQKINVPKNKYQLEEVLVTETPYTTNESMDKNTLTSLLDKAAQYCQKLKKATFYFVCIEEVIDNYWIRGQQVKEDHYLFDYQILMGENGHMKESRQLKKKVPKLGNNKTRRKRRKKNREKETEIIYTNFFSNYPFLMPNSMLAEEYRQKYRFRLLGQEKIGNHTLIKICVDPRQEGVMQKGSNYGVVWIDQKDGSVYKIELAANSVGGLAKLKQEARKKRNRLKITDVHWYEVQRNGLRFPSRTEINGYYLDWNQAKGTINKNKLHALEQVGTIFEYKNYKFFKVNVDVLESTHQE
jgi:hypothetical protein